MQNEPTQQLLSFKLVIKATYYITDRQTDNEFDRHTASNIGGNKNSWFLLDNKQYVNKKEMLS